MTKLTITLPSGDIGFVEDKRSFCVQGIIESDKPLNENSSIVIHLIDSNNMIVRTIMSKCKNQAIVKDYPGLITYQDELDKGREKMLAFGFPELLVDDKENIEASIHKASIKCWHSDTSFKAIIVNASSINSGALLDDGMHLVDDNGNDYYALEKGEYKILVELYEREQKIAEVTKKFIIGKRKYQTICRFNPLSHKERMMNWCKENDIAIISDLLPGYLEPYLGTWYYHMGLLKMYRANDICLFDNVKALMFDYLIDPTSTSYETELGYLQSIGVIDNPNRLEVYHYDIGEAKVQGQEAKIIKFNQDEYVYLCRIDEVNEKAKENVYFLDERQIQQSFFDTNIINVKPGETFAFMGVIKPWQMDQKDFILKDDNTYTMGNHPDTIHYTFKIDGNETVYYRKTLMDRIGDYSIGTSIFEFYNLININKEWLGKSIILSIDVLDVKANLKSLSKQIIINVIA